MNKDNAALFLPLVTALADGKTIQIKDAGGGWTTLPDYAFRGNVAHYRIKPEPSRTATIMVDGRKEVCRLWASWKVYADTDIPISVVARMNQRYPSDGPYTLINFEEKE